MTAVRRKSPGRPVTTPSITCSALLDWASRIVGADIEPVSTEAIRDRASPTQLLAGSDPKYSNGTKMRLSPTLCDPVVHAEIKRTATHKQPSLKNTRLRCHDLLELGQILQFGELRLVLELVPLLKSLF